MKQNRKLGIDKIDKRKIMLYNKIIGFLYDFVTIKKVE